MNIVFLSGKGGTGKTTLSTNFAVLNNYNYFDCDVEEPNGQLFLKPEINKKEKATILNPLVNSEKCINCNICVENCQFGALLGTKDKILVFNELCHGCGTCKLSCKYDAITEFKREIGDINIGKFKKNKFVSGVLNLKEPLAVPVIKKVKEHINTDQINIIDAPPGSSCDVVETLQDADYAVLVTEPTEYGLSDMINVLKVVKKLKIKFGIIINRSTKDDYVIEDLIKKNNYKLLGKIPFKMKFAKIYSEGNLLIENRLFKEKLTDITKKVKKHAKI